eukprot:gene6717-7426_t
MNINVTVTVAEGHWRLTASSAILACPIPQTCAGGSGYGDTLCEGLFGGTLCAQVVEEGNYFDVVLQDVETCSASTTALPILFPLMTIAALLYLLFFVVGRPVPLSTSRQEKEEGEGLGDCEQGLCFLSLEDSPASRSVRVWDSHGLVWLTRCRLALLWLQVTSSLPATFHLALPPATASLLRAQSWLSLQTLRSLPWRCLGLSSVTLLEEMEGSSLAPLLLGLIVSFVGLILHELLYWLPSRTKKERRRAQEVTWLRLVTGLHLFVQLLLGNASALAFSSFHCVEVDDEVGDVLFADPSVRCEGYGYMLAKMWAGAVAAIYSVILPGLFLGLAYLFRHNAIRYFYLPSEKLGGGRLTSLAAVYAAYSYENLLFEGWETSLRLFFVAALPVIATFSMHAALVLALGAGMTHLFLLLTRRPYHLPALQYAAVAACIGFLVLLLGCLALYLEGTGGPLASSVLLDAILCCAALLPLLLVLLPQDLCAPPAPSNAKNFLFLKTGPSSSERSRKVKRCRTKRVVTSSSVSLSSSSSSTSFKKPKPTSPPRGKTNSSTSSSSGAAFISRFIQPEFHHEGRHGRKEEEKEDEGDEESENGQFECEPRVEVMERHASPRRLPFPRLPLPLSDGPPSPDSTPPASPRDRQTLLQAARTAAARLYGMWGDSEEEEEKKLESADDEQPLSQRRRRKAEEEPTVDLVADLLPRSNSSCDSVVESIEVVQQEDEGQQVGLRGSDDCTVEMAWPLDR